MCLPCKTDLAWSEFATLLTATAIVVVVVVVAVIGMTSIYELETITVAVNKKNRK